VKDERLRKRVISGCSATQIHTAAGGGRWLPRATTDLARGGGRGSPTPTPDLAGRGGPVSRATATGTGSGQPPGSGEAPSAAPLACPPRRSPTPLEEGDRGRGEGG